MAMAGIPIAAAGTDKLPSGSWSYGPITVQWSVKNNDELDISISILGFDIDDLSGTLSPNDAKVTNTINILGLIAGSLTFEAKYNQGPATDGLWISGQLKGPGFDTGVLNHRIIPW
jgi:hypothetical protein